jgi:type II secretory pathway component PulJ
MLSIRSGSGRRHRRRSAKAGFSLVEVLAALVITILLVLSFTPFVGQMLATWSRGTEAARLVELKMRGIGRLRGDLRHAIAWTGFGQTEKLAAFRGTESSISFPVATGLSAGRHGLEMLSITVDTAVDGRALVRRRAAFIGSTYASFQNPVVLFSGPFRYVFRYYARDGRESPVWDNPLELPARIKLTIADQRGAVFSAPIELPTFASLSAGCLASPNLPGCPVQPKEDENAWMKQFGLTPEGQ